MKLLEKSEIEKKKNVEKTLEVNQGSILAKRIDGLRELYSFEEARIQLFREESLNNLKEELHKKRLEINEANKEVDILREERYQLLLPLDDEWVKITNTQLQLTKTQEELDVREKKIEKRHEYVLKQEYLLHQNKEELNKLQKNISLHLISAQNKDKQAGSVLDRALKHANGIYSKVQKVTDTLISRETDIAVRERDLLIQEQHIKATQEAQEKERQHIYSQQQTLQAAYAGLKNK